MIGVVKALVEVSINSSVECFQGGVGHSIYSLAVLGKNECLCASILEYGMENRFRKVCLI